MIKKKDRVVVAGIGWVTQERYGSVMLKLHKDYTDKVSLHSQLRDESVFLQPVKNFGRFDETSKKACSAVALAVRDAGITYSKDLKKDIGLVGTNIEGSLFSNISYFEDYVKNGRTLARGNLFTYTLPSSPLAEAAINCGCQGPLLYINFSSQKKQISLLLRYAQGMIHREEAPAMLAINADEKEGVCFFLKRENHGLEKRLCILEDALDIVEKAPNLEDVISGFERYIVQKKGMKSKEVKDIKQKRRIDMKKLLVLLLCLGLYGCASTGVVPMDKDTYMISKRSAQLGWGQPVGAKAAVYREANEFCARQNKKVETVSFEMRPSLPASPGSVCLQFRCVSDSDDSLNK